MTTPTQPGQNASDAGETLAGAGALLAQVSRLERELAELGDRLAQSERLAALGSMAAVVAHELNNVLTPVTSYAQLALDTPDEPELTRKALEAAIEGVARAERITASVLGLTRDDTPETISLVGAATQTDATGGALTCKLRETVTSALSCLSASSRDDGIAVRVEVADATLGIPGTDLYRVLVNLLLNARRAVLTQQDTPRVIAISTALTDKDAVQSDDAASLIEIVVSDSGPGVPSAIRDRLFEPFATCPVSAQVEGGSVDRGVCRDGGGAASAEGSGLGLSISRELVDRAGGALVVDPPSATGSGGAVFRVRLPVVG